LPRPDTPPGAFATDLNAVPSEARAEARHRGAINFFIM